MAFLDRDDKVFLEVLSVLAGAGAVLGGFLAKDATQRNIATVLGLAAVASRAVVATDRVMDLTQPPPKVDALPRNT